MLGADRGAAGEVVAEAAGARRGLARTAADVGLQDLRGVRGEEVGAADVGELRLASGKAVPRTTTVSSAWEAAGTPSVSAAAAPAATSARETTCPPMSGILTPNANEGHDLS